MESVAPCLLQLTVVVVVKEYIYLLLACYILHSLMRYSNRLKQIPQPFRLILGWCKKDNSWRFKVCSIWIKFPEWYPNLLSWFLEEWEADSQNSGKKSTELRNITKSFHFPWFTLMYVLMWLPVWDTRATSVLTYRDCIHCEWGKSAIGMSYNSETKSTISSYSDQHVNRPTCVSCDCWSQDNLRNLSLALHGLCCVGGP